jgi:hypothetical protein
MPHKSRPRVGDLQPDFAFDAARANYDPATLARALLHGVNRILNQIHQHLLDLERIGRGHD